MDVFTYEYLLIQSVSVLSSVKFIQSDGVFEGKCLDISYRIDTKRSTCGFYRYEQIYTYRRQNFKTFLKANYAIVLYSCYLLIIKNMWNMESNMFC